MSTYWCNVWISLHFKSIPSKFVFSTIFGCIGTIWWVVRGYKVGFRPIFVDISTYWCNVWLSLLLYNSFPSKIGFRTVFGGISTYWYSVWVSLLHCNSLTSKFLFSTMFHGISTHWWIVRGKRLVSAQSSMI